MSKFHYAKYSTAERFAQKVLSLDTLGTLQSVSYTSIPWFFSYLVSFFPILCAHKVLSIAIADAFAHFGDPSTRETQKFILMFDRCFDCLNVRDFNQWKEKRKSDLKP